MDSKKIVVVGSCNTDMVIRADRLPGPGETILGGTFLMNPGGKGANQAVAAARMGGDVILIAKTGNDLFGRQSLELFSREKLDTGYVFSDPEQPSGVALITVDAQGENCIVVASGANGCLVRGDIDRAAEAIRGCGLVLMQLEIPVDTVEYVAQLAHAAGIPVILNPAPAQTLPDSLLKNLFMIIPNRGEAEVLSGVSITGRESAMKAAEILRSKGVDNVVITLGSEGALILESGDFKFVDAHRVEAVDTTAAGDTFCGTFAVGLSEGKSIEASVRLAVSAAAIAVTRMGAQSSIPYRAEVDPAGAGFTE
jgi:ribokinase